MALPKNLGDQIVAGAVATAGQAWTQIKTAAEIELRGLAQRIVLIVETFEAGEISEASAKRHLQTARFHVIATIAMLTTMVEAAVAKIVNGAIAKIREAVNTAVGFKLLI